MLIASLAALALAPADSPLPAPPLSVPMPDPLPVPLPPPVPVLVALPPVDPPILFLDLPLPPTQLPDSIRSLARAAFDAGDDATWQRILKLSRATNPQAEAQIEALEAEYTARRAEEVARAARERAERLAAASMLDNWKGEVELGGARLTGNTDSLAIFGAIRFEREGLKWRHLVNGRADFQRSGGETTADRLKFGWQPSYKVNEALFVYSLGQYERDRFLGFASRYTLSSGIGFSIIATPDTKLSLQGGPAVRYTDYVDKSARPSGAGRASLAFRWKISPTLSLSQDAAVYFEEGNSNAMSATALETQLIGNLKARLAYDVQYEKNDIADRKPLDTTSRVTLVYGF